MFPGYYVVLRDTVLTGSAHRLHLYKGDWLVTDGDLLGRFDKIEEFDWVPLEWVRGAPVVLDETVGPELEKATIETTPQRLEPGFHKLLFVEPGEPMPDLPRPKLTQLSPYLRARRNLVAYTYDHRS
jgi:hypothetical protein